MDALTRPTTSKGAALGQRYGADALPPAGPWNETIGTLLAHRSVRGYLPDALPAGTLETLVAAAQSAATSSSGSARPRTRRSSACPISRPSWWPASMRH